MGSCYLPSSPIVWWRKFSEVNVNLDSVVKGIITNGEFQGLVQLAFAKVLLDFLENDKVGKDNGMRSPVGGRKRFWKKRYRIAA